MADALRRTVAGLAMLLGVNAALAASPDAAGARVMHDPMQPPATNASMQGAPADGTDAARSSTDGNGLPQLGSIRRAGSAAPRAFLNGQWVTAGATLGSWRVRAIKSDSVILQSTSNPQETQTLQLHQLSIRRVAAGS